MDDRQREMLRAPFPPNAVGKLPKPYRKDSDKGNCRECGGYHGLPAMHLDYVGHAAVTDLFLKVDPEWNWEPVAFDQAGLPAIDSNGGLWIRLTIAGVTRYGYGHADGNRGGDAIKTAIGDALRNAAMRFGVALDLWSKEDLRYQPDETAPPASPAQQPPPPQQSNGNGNGHASNGGSRAQGLSPEMLAVRTRVSTAGKALGFTVPQINEDFARENGGLTIPSASVEQLTGYAEDLESRVTAGASS